MFEKSYKWLSILRISSVTAILGTAAYYFKDIFGLVVAIHLAVLIFITYAITFALWSYIKDKKPRAIFAYLLFSLDISIYTLIIFTTGGLDSSFLFLYAIAVIAAAIVLSTPGAFFAAGYSSLMLFFMAALIYRNIVPPTEFFDTAPGHLMDTNLFFEAFFQSLFLFLIAAFSSYLTEAIKTRTIELGRLRESLHRAKMDTSAILHNIPSGVIVTDMDGNILYINEIAKNILSLDGASPPNIAQLETQWPEFYNYLKKNSENGTFPIETEITRDGRTYILTISRFPKSKRLISTIQDITEQKKLENKLREQERYALLGHQMAEMVHSLGNPVAALKGVAQILQSGTTHENQQKLIKILNKELDKMASILHRYRQFSKIHDINPKPVNISGFFEKLMKTINYMVVGKDIKVVLSFRNAPETAEFDPQKLEEAIMNIVRNSIEALKFQGVISITVYSPGMEVNGFKKKWKIPENEWGIGIADNGEGIPQSIMDRIFTPSFTTKARGLGLGLAITKRIIEVHGGTIDFDTVEGMGTMFLIMLPLKMGS